MFTGRRPTNTANALLLSLRPFGIEEQLDKLQKFPQILKLKFKYTEASSKTTKADDKLSTHYRK